MSERARQARRAELASLAILLLAAALLLAPALFAGKTPYYRDITLADLPQVAFLFRSVAQGQFPLWNPVSGGGYPQLAGMQPPFFYPPELLFFPGALGWCSWGLALTLFLLLHYWLAGAFTYALCRHWLWPRTAALGAALAYMLSGYLVSLHNLFTNLPPASLFPLLVLVVDRLLDQPRSRALAAASLAFALQTGCGRPDVSVMTLMYLTGHALWHAWAAGRPGTAARMLRALALLALVAGLGAVANAAMLLPAREFLAHSNRAGGILTYEMTGNSFPLLQCLLLVMPGFFGSVEQGADWGKYFIAEPPVHYSLYYLTLYSGMIVYLLATWARSPARQRGLVPFLWIVAAASFLLALGKYAPFFGWYAYLPVARYIRYPVKFFFLWAWALALLAGLGLKGSGNRGLRAGTMVWGLLLGALLLAIAFRQQCLAWLLAVDYDPWSMATRQDLPDPNGYMRAILPAVWPQTLQLAADAWCWGAAALALQWLRSRRPQITGLLLALLAADLLAHNAPLIHYTDRSLFQEVPPLVTFLQHHSGEPPLRMSRPYGDETRLGRPTERLRELAQHAHAQEYVFRQRIEGLSYLTNHLFGVPGMPFFVSLKLAPSAGLMLEELFPDAVGSLRLGNDNEKLDRYSRVAGAANVGFILVPVANAGKRAPPEPPNLHGNPNFALAWQDGTELFLYRNRHLLPRASFLTDALVVPGLEDAQREVYRGASLLAHRVVLVQDEALAETLKLRASLPRQAPGQDRSCRIISYEDLQVVIENRSPESGFLVLADNYYPGWQAAVDGQPRPIMLANAFGRAVYVEAGRHLVAFTYRPATFPRGVLLSLLTLLVLGLLLGSGGQRSRDVPSYLPDDDLPVFRPVDPGIPGQGTGS